MKNFIYGAGGHGKVVFDAMRKSKIKCHGFIDENPKDSWAGLQVYGTKILSSTISDISIHIAIGDCRTRQNISTNLKDLSFLKVIHPNAILSNNCQFGDGTFIAAGSIIGYDAKIGNHCIINHSAIIDHDCFISDYCHIAPNACIGGGVKLGKGILVGSGATILPGITVGDYAIIGAGSVVTKNIENESIVKGNPASI